MTQLGPSLDLDFRDVVPDSLAAFRPLVADGLRYFLRRLSAARQSRLATEQMALPPDTSLPQRLIRILHHCPTLHKLGQVLSRHSALDTELLAALRTLESLEPRTLLSELQPMLDVELAGAAEFEPRVADVALAEGSVAVVVPCTWRDPRTGVQRTGVLKVLKPEVEAHLSEELAIWPDLAAYLDSQCRTYGLPDISLEDTFHGVGDLLANEVHLDGEQEHLILAERIYREYNWVDIPAVLPFSTPRVTAMSQLQGCLVADIGELSALQREQLAEMIVTALLAVPMWSLDDEAVFHADPHAGNLMLTNEGRLAILDWSLVGRLARSDRVQLMQVIVAALTLDASRVARAIAVMSSATPDESALRSVVEEGLRRIRRGERPGIRWLTDLMNLAVSRTGVRFNTGMLLFRKVMLTLEGVVAHVAPDFSIDAVLISSAMQNFVREWPERLLWGASTGPFRTNLSNSDLLELAYAGPATAARYWLDTWRDWTRRD